jgi:hypothetical protein
MPGEKDDDGVSAITTVIAALKPLDEKTRKNVLDFVLKQLGIELMVAADPDEAKPNSRTPLKTPAIPTPAGEQVDIRSLGEQKHPKTVNEKVALVAYYLRNLAPQDERRDHIVAADISRYFVEAGFALPIGPANMTLTNAKNAGYLNSAGPGQYRLNAVGHNLITHRLPSGDVTKTKRKKVAKKKGR